MRLLDLVEGTVITAKVRSHSRVFGLRQFSHSPARPKGSFMPPSLLGQDAGLAFAASEEYM